MRILISGGGDMGRITAETLANLGHDVILIEENREVCERIASESDLMVLCGDGTKPDMLEKGEIKKADVVIALSGSDKVNLITALVAKEYGVQRVIIKLDDPSFNIVCIKLGVEEIINPKVATAKHISDIVKEPHALEISTLVGGSIRAFTAIIKKAEHVGKHISALNLPEDCFPIILQRGNEFFMLNEDIKIFEGDRLEILCEEKSLETIKDIFS